LVHAALVKLTTDSIVVNLLVLWWSPSELVEMDYMNSLSGLDIE